MSNSYYNHGSYPTTGAPGASASLRSELDSITSGFNLLPTISGNGNKAVIVNSGATALSVTTGTLALAGNFATTGAYNTTLIQGATTSLTLPLVSGTLATLAGTEEFTNKTLTSAVAKGTWTASGTWTLPALTLGGAITYGGVTLSNAVTGTNNMVLSASPTLTGTIAAASQTLSGTFGVTGVATFTAQPIMSSLTASKPVFTDASKGLTSTGTLAYDQGGTGQTSYAAGDIIYASGINTLTKLAIGTTGQRLIVSGGVPSWSTDATIGTVTSVGWTGGIVSVATATTTPAFTIAGTSGGVPYFDSGTTWATSAALAANALVLGGGAGAAPATTTTGTGVVTALGVNTGTAGAFVVDGGALGTPSSGTVTNLTGTASININGTVGATTPAAGSFTTLSASSTSTMAAINASGTVAMAGAATVGTTLAVSGTSTMAAINASGKITSTLGNNQLIFDSASATTGYQQMRMINTSGSIVLGVENSTGGAAITGDTAYDATIAGASGIAFSANNGSAMQMRLASTGLAVTGTLSVSGTSTMAAINASGLVTGNAGLKINLDANSFQLVGKFQNNNAGTGTSAVVLSSDSTYYKAGLALQRADANGAGTLYLLNRASNDAANVAITDVVMQFSQAGAATIPGTLGITGTTTAAAINASGLVAMAGAATVGTTLGVTGLSTLGTDALLSLTTKGYFNSKYNAAASLWQWGPGTVSTGNAFGFTVGGTNVLDLLSGGIAVTGTLSVSGTSTMAAINASGSVTLSGTSFFRSPTTSDTPGTFNFYLAASGIREGTAGDFNIDTYNGGWGARLTVSQAGAVTINGTSAGNMLKIVASASGTRGDATYQSWYRANGTTRKGYFGFAGADEPDITLATEEAGGTIELLNNTKIKIGGGTPMTNFIGFGQNSNNTPYSVITFNEVYTAEGFSGVRGGVAGDLFLNVPTGSAILGRVNNADVFSIGAAGITIANGTVAAPSLVFAGDSDSGFFKGTGSSILAGLNGTEVLNINTSTFDVKGALACNFPANVSIVGALSKGSGSFRIAHPLPALNETHDLVHSFIEGPQADLIYRGRVALVDGKATVNIDTAATMSDGTFELLCRDVQCFTSNETDWNHVRGSFAGNILTIECQDTASIATISWMVIGERQDKHMMDTTWTDDNGKVIVEPLKPIPPTVVEEDVPQYTGTTHKDTP